MKCCFLNNSEDKTKDQTQITVDGIFTKKDGCQILEINYF